MRRRTLIASMMLALALVVGCGSDPVDPVPAGADAGADVHDIGDPEDVADTSDVPDTGDDSADSADSEEHDGGERDSGDAGPDDVSDATDTSDTKAVEWVDTQVPDAFDADLSDDGADLSDDGADLADAEPEVSDGGDVTGDADDAGDIVQIIEPLPAAPCPTLSPVMAYHQVAVVDEAGLWLTGLGEGTLEPVASWETDYVPQDPAVIPGGVDVAFVIALNGPNGCRLRALDVFGDDAWQQEVPQSACFSPSVTEQGLMVVLATPTGGAVRLLDPATGALVVETIFSATPTSPATLISSGGSHWVIGAGPNLLRFELSDGQAGPAGQVAVAIPTVTEVVSSGTGLLVAAGEQGFAAFSAASGGALAPLGAAVSLPGERTTTVLAADDCGDGDTISSGGSHWWCPGTAVVVGGDGWLGVWDPSTGGSILDESLDQRVTALALGADGTIYSGGSHWVPVDGGDWSLSAVTTTGAPGALTFASSPLASGTLTLDVCPASPLLDGDGRLAMAVGDGTVARVMTGSAGLVSGWSRRRGDNVGAGRSSDVAAECPGGATKLYEAALSGTEAFDVARAVGLDDGTIVLSGRRANQAWIAGYGPGGAELWSEPQLTDDPLLPSFTALARSADGVIAAAVSTDTTRVLSAFRFTPTGGGTIAPNPWPLSDSAVAVDAASDPTTGGIAVLIEDDSTTGYRVLWLAPDGSVSIDQPFGTEVDATTIGPVPGSSDMFVLAQSQDTFGHVTRVRTDGSVAWSDTFDHGPPPELLDVFVDEAGGAQVLYRMEGQARIRTYVDGGVLDFETIVELLPQRFVRDSTGVVGILTQDFQFARTGDSGSLVGLVDLAPDAAILAPVAAVDVPPAGLVLVGRAGDTESTARVHLVRATSYGATGCADAGLCIGLGDSACEDDNPCTYGVCDPTTGQCAQEFVTTGTPCGDQKACEDGICI